MVVMIMVTFTIGIMVVPVIIIVVALIVVLVVLIRRDAILIVFTFDSLLLLLITCTKRCQQGVSKYRQHAEGNERNGISKTWDCIGSYWVREIDEALWGVWKLERR